MLRNICSGSFRCGVRTLLTAFAISQLIGCATMLDSVLNSAVEANATPESMGISTAQYRSYPCNSLGDLAMAMSKEQNNPSKDALTRKAFGWHVDAIRQVEREKGCTTAAGFPAVQAVPAVIAVPGGATGTAGQAMPMFFYCYATNTDARKTIASQVFEQRISTSGPSQLFQMIDAFQSEFKRDVLDKNSMNENALCVYEDSEDKALRSRAKHRSLFSGFTLSYIDVAWKPVSQTSSIVSQTTPSSPSGKGSIGISVSQQLAQAVALGLGLPNTQGVLVVEVAKGGSAEKAGMKPMDVILDFSGQLVSQPSELMAMLAKTRPGFLATLRIWRDRAVKDIVVEIGALAN